jgi:hypothetical protein
MSNILEDYKIYTGKHGLVHPWSDRGSNNGVLYTAQAIMALKKHGALNTAEHGRLVTVYANCEGSPGLTHRAPDNPGLQEGPDDYFGAFYADLVLNTGFSKRFLTYGRTEGATSCLPKESQSAFLTRVIYNILSRFGTRPAPFVYNNPQARVFN